MREFLLEKSIVFRRYAREVWLITALEFKRYFITPVAAVYVVVFLMMLGVLTFYMGGLYDANQANLSSFFVFHPWLYLVMCPAVAMRLWSEEYRMGTIELVLTSSVELKSWIIGKFLASVGFICVAMLGTIPIWLTVNILGDADDGVIMLSYIGSILICCIFLALSMMMSALTNNQIVAFVLSVSLGFVLMFSSLDFVVGFLQPVLPEFLLDAVASLSIINHFSGIVKGLITLSDIVYFVVMTGLFLYLTYFIVKKRFA